MVLSALLQQPYKFENKIQNKQFANVFNKQDWRRHQDTDITVNYHECTHYVRGQEVKPYFQYSVPSSVFLMQNLLGQIRFLKQLDHFVDPTARYQIKMPKLPTVRNAFLRFVFQDGQTNQLTYTDTHLFDLISHTKMKKPNYYPNIEPTEIDAKEESYVVLRFRLEPDMPTLVSVTIGRETYPATKTDIAAYTLQLNIPEQGEYPMILAWSDGRMQVLPGFLEVRSPLLDINESSSEWHNPQVQRKYPPIYVEKRFCWPPGTCLKVFFIPPTDPEEAVTFANYWVPMSVMFYMQEWLPYCGVSIEQTDCIDEAHIRVSPDGTNMACIGRLARQPH